MIQFFSRALRFCVGALAVTTTFLLLFVITRADNQQTAIFLPGTQPMSLTLQSSATCAQCHGNPTRPDVRIYPDWKGSMMAHSARDPIFYAALAVSNKYREADKPGEFCLRCHAPTGWLAGHSEDFTGRSIIGQDLEGVACDYCHRTVDPMNPDTTVPLMSLPVPGYGNAMHVIQRQYEPKRGPFAYPYIAPDSSHFNPPHRAMQYDFIESANLCGICHDISNPFQVSEDVRDFQPPYSYAPIERTFSEWEMSWYAQQGEEGTCQHCHMADTSGYACVYAAAPHRDEMGRHDMTGGNTFVPDILGDFWSDLDSLSLAQAQEGKVRAAQTLQRAADVTADAFRLHDTVFAKIRITNLTGHKLPTGYPHGRRMWLSVVATDSSGDTVFQSGKYDNSTAVLNRDNQLKIYEAVFGITDTAAQRFGVAPGPSFHFILDDTIFSDNRIPPKGFTNESFYERNAMPVAAHYDDGQYWDNTKYVIPHNAANISVKLMYQTISKEYVEFLKTANDSNSYDWGNFGSRLDSSWNIRGKSTPTVMNNLSIPVRDSVTTGVSNPLKPLATGLAQNYPNPFNPVTNFDLTVGTFSLVSVKVFDIEGKEVAALMNEMKSPGIYHIPLDAGKLRLSSGMYFVRMNAGGLSFTRKIVLLK